MNTWILSFNYGLITVCALVSAWLIEDWIPFLVLAAVVTFTAMFAPVINE